MSFISLIIQPQLSRSRESNSSRENESGGESLKSSSRSEYKGVENGWNRGKVKKTMNSVV